MAELNELPPLQGDGEPVNDSAPVVLIPVSAEDVARHKRRIAFWWWTAALTVLLIAGYEYKRWVDPTHAQQSFEAGMTMYAVARYPQAIVAFDRAASLAPKNPDAFLMRGRANAGDQRIDAAIADFTKALELRPNDTQAMLERAREYLELKRYSAAIDDANRAIAVDSRFAPAYNVRGVAIRKLGDPKKALEDFTRAIELSAVTDNYFQRGATYQMLGDHRRALADFDQMIALQPDAAPAYFARAESRLAIGDVRGAEMDREQGRILDGR